MWKEGCEIELSIYDASKWWSFLTVFKSVSLAIKYDQGIYVIYKNGFLSKVKESEIIKRITYTEKRTLECRSWYVGKIWLDSCIISNTKFSDMKEFGKEYMEAVGSLD